MFQLRLGAAVEFGPSLKLKVRVPFSLSKVSIFKTSCATLLCDRTVKCLVY